MSYKEYKQAREKAINDFMQNYCFIAFGEDFKPSLNEYLIKNGIDPEDQTQGKIKLVTMAGGVYMLKNFYTDIYKPLQEELNAVYKNEIEKNQESLIEAFICELENHEFSYTQDTTDTIEALGYSAEEIEQNNYLNESLVMAIDKYRALNQDY